MPAIRLQPPRKKTAIEEVDGPKASEEEKKDKKKQGGH